MMLDLAAEERTVARLYEEWQAALAARDATVAYASANKCDPGKDYWHTERTARLKYQMALTVYTELRGMTT
jgi:hypothetical protein